MNDSNEIFLTPKVLMVIVNAEKAHDVISMLNHEHTPILYQFHAYGTATSEMLDILGFGGVDKTVIISVAPDYFIKQLLYEISKGVDFDLRGEGIAFTVPVSGITGRAMATLINDVVMSAEKDAKRKRKVFKMKNKNEHDLVVVVAKRGYSEAIVEVAKAAGATGGTVWAAGKIGLEEPIKVLGVTLQSEQEIIAMLIEKKKKHDIMYAIKEKYGINSEAQGLILSLPVDSVYGLEEDA